MKAFALALAIFSASASAQTISSPSGSTWTLLPSSVRVYTNVNGARQVDALFSTTKPVDRIRIAVTGCSTVQGQLAQVDLSGNAIAEVLNWSVEGDRVYDLIAVQLCRAARSTPSQGA
jgi:hypothetical protein